MDDKIEALLHNVPKKCFISWFDRKKTQTWISSVYEAISNFLILLILRCSLNKDFFFISNFTEDVTEALGEVNRLPNILWETKGKARTQTQVFLTLNILPLSPEFETPTFRTEEKQRSL